LFHCSHVRAIDSQLDQLQQRSQSISTQENASDPQVSSRLEHLQTLVKTLSTTSMAIPYLVGTPALVTILQDAHFSGKCTTCQQNTLDLDREPEIQRVPHSSYEHELEWLVVGKATAQVYGTVLSKLIQQTIPLNEELWYWNDVLASYPLTALYSVQTSPFRFWKWSKGIYQEVRERRDVVVEGWQQFYALVQTVIHDRSVADMQRRAASPLTLVRTEIKQKRASLERAKLLNASGIGYLLSNCFNNER